MFKSHRHCHFHHRHSRNICELGLHSQQCRQGGDFPFQRKKDGLSSRLHFLLFNILDHSNMSPEEEDVVAISASSIIANMKSITVQGGGWLSIPVSSEEEGWSLSCPLNYLLFNHCQHEKHLQNTVTLYSQTGAGEWLAILVSPPPEGRALLSCCWQRFLYPFHPFHQHNQLSEFHNFFNDFVMDFQQFLNNVKALMITWAIWFKDLIQGSSHRLSGPLRSICRTRFGILDKILRSKWAF